MTRQILMVAVVCMMMLGIGGNTGSLIRGQQGEKDDFRRLDASAQADLMRLKDKPLRALQKEKRDLVREELNHRMRAWLAGARNIAIEYLYDTQKRLLEADLALAETAREKQTAVEQIWMIARQVEMVAIRQMEAGTIDPAQMARAKANRVDAEIELAKLKAK